MFVGRNILHVVHSAQETSKELGRAERDIESILTVSREALYHLRQHRPRPGLDDKILLSRNGLMISAFARAFQILRDRSYLEAAKRAASVLDLYEASLDIEWLRCALDLTEEQVRLLYDREHGGFFDAQPDELSGLVRMKDSHDGATPSGNAVAITNLLRLSAMLHDDRYRDIANRSLRAFSSAMRKAPQSMAQFLVALDASLNPACQVIVAGPREDPDTEAIVQLVQSRFKPTRVVLYADGGEGQTFQSVVLRNSPASPLHFCPTLPRFPVQPVRGLKIHAH